MRILINTPFFNLLMVAIVFMMTACTPPPAPMVAGDVLVDSPTPPPIPTHVYLTDTPGPTSTTEVSPTSTATTTATATSTPTSTSTPTPTATPSATASTSASAAITDAPTSTEQPTLTSTSDSGNVVEDTPTADNNTVSDDCRSYAKNSPWNKKIPGSAATHPDSSQMIGALEGTFGSNPDSWTLPIYTVNNGIPLVNMQVSNQFRKVTNGGSTLEKAPSGSTIQVPIPNGARPSAGDDGQFVVLNTDTGDEWGFYQARKQGGSWSSTGAYQYNIAWSGVPPDGFAGRGGGSPYLAGVVRPCEINQGVIEHALVLGYDYPCKQEVCAAQGYPHFVFPAIKSDGRGDHPYDMPEGARLQLDPNASEATINQWCGTDQTCRIIVRAMQDYGIYVMEQSGHPKIFVEDNATANWGSLLKNSTVSNIPYSAFRVLDWNK